MGHFNFHITKSSRPIGATTISTWLALRGIDCRIKVGDPGRRRNDRASGPRPLLVCGQCRRGLAATRAWTH